MLWLWQTTGYPRLVPVPTRGIKKYIAEPEVQTLADWISSRPFLDATFWLSSAYALLVGGEYQAKNAMYFTPPMLADRLIDNLLNHGASLTRHVWKDPACGGGAFLTPVALRMVISHQQEGATDEEIVRAIEANLVGSDINPVLTTLSKYFIYMAVYQQLCRANYFPKLNIIRADSLNPPKRKTILADVVICNPPYRKMARAEVDVYRSDFNEVIEGQPNLYGLFMRQCFGLAKPNALVGLLTPTSYLSGQNFSRLRKKITELSYIRQLDLIRQREGVFLRVEQETALSIFQSRPASNNSCNPATVFIFEQDSFKDIGKFTAPVNGGAWILPRDPDDARLLKDVKNSNYRLCDYGYSVRTGAYVYYRDKKVTYEARPDSSVRNAIFPLIWSSDITTDRNLVLGRATKQEKRDTYIDMVDPNHVSVIRNPCVALQRITSTDQGRRLVAASVPEEILRQAGGVVGENHVLFLEQTIDNPPVTPTQLAAILASETIDRLFRCISGAVNVSIFELNQLPLPAPQAIAKLLAENDRSTDDAVRLAFSYKEEATPAQVTERLVS